MHKTERRIGALAGLALSLSRLLLCHEPDGGLNCGRCHACELTASGNHGDFRWLQPGDKSRVIKIDQVREVVEFGNKTAAFGRRISADHSFLKHPERRMASSGQPLLRSKSRSQGWCG